jgi:hypothetical protein
MAKRSSATGWAGFVMLAAAAVVMLIPSSAAAAQVVSCGAAIVQDTKLDHDLDCPDTALTISADGVTLDLAGHEITGHGQGVGVVNLKWQAFELRRGQMAGFEAGALLGSLMATAPRRGPTATASTAWSSRTTARPGSARWATTAWSSA